MTAGGSRLRLTVIGVVLAAVVSLAAWSVAWNRREAALDERLYVPRMTKLTAEAALLQSYIRIDTSNPPGRELAGAKFLAEELRRAGLTPEVIESAPGRGNVYARLRGRSPGGALMLLSHIDVVPATGKWRRPPFSGDIVLNMIHGRGAIDMKGITVSHLAAIVEIARSGRQPDHDLVFLATADEEAGGHLGVEWLLAHRPDLFEGVQYAFNEGGITETQREKLTYFGVETGAKQLTEVELTAPTVEALQSARVALEPFFDPRDPTRVLPGVRTYFSAVAPTRLENQETLTDIDATIAGGKYWLVPEVYRALLANTIRAYGAQKRGNGAAMKVLLFNLPDENPNARLAWLADRVRPFGVSVGTPSRKEGPAPISDSATPLFAIIRQEVARQYPGVPVGPLVLALSTNDSRYLRARGITCYGVQPFQIDFFQSLSVHGIDERITVDWFAQGVAMMKRIVTSYAFSGR